MNALHAIQQASDPVETEYQALMTAVSAIRPYPPHPGVPGDPVFEFLIRTIAKQSVQIQYLRNDIDVLINYVSGLKP